RKPSTLSTYRSLLRAHLVPHLGDRTLDRIEPVHVERLVAGMRRGGAGPKLTSNALTLLYQVFEFGRRKGWCETNPCKAVDRPKVEEHSDIRFLEMEEIEALLSAVPEDDPLGQTDRALYLTAAMTGLRQGELLALRWRDVDWTAQRIRVRNAWIRGEHSAEGKSDLSTRRSVPMTDRLARELDRAKLVTGSEGTLVAVTVSTVGLVPLPKARMFAVGHFESVADAIAATDAALARTGWPRLGAWAAGFFAYLVAGLIYQPSALFFVVPLAAALLLKSDAARARLAWCAAHLATGLGGLATGFVAMRMVFALGWLKQATVFGLETDPLAKLVWFVSGPVANSLGLFALRDRFDTPLAFWVAVVLVTALIAAGFLWRVNREPIDKWTALFCLFVLPFVAFAVNLAAALRVPSYRTTYGLAGLVVVFIVYALGSLRAGGRLSRSAHYAALSLMLVIGAVAANRHAYTLIAEPQGWEWQIMLDAASRFEPGMKVYVIHSSTANRATQRTFADEFGSLSSDTDWAVEAMFNCALRRRFPSGVPASTYTLRAGPEAPHGGTFDLVIDMRQLRQHRAD
ncbi:MAG: site-specific integrase, partial [Burkholderiales bacterium]